MLARFVKTGFGKSFHYVISRMAMDDSTQPIAWDTTWRCAAERFGSLNSDAMLAMSRLIGELALMAEVRGLFAIPTMTTLWISPYSCYPDWFDGRFITVDANNSDSVSVRVVMNGHDTHKNRIDCSFTDAAATIAALCRDYL